MNTIRRMDHFTVVTEDVAGTTAFYGRLGLRSGPRPGFSVEGVWLYAEDHPVLHVVKVGAMPALRRGALDHMAFFGVGIAELLEDLRAQGIGYRVLRLPRPWTAWQVFFEDPNGAEVEIDFDGAEVVPPHLKPAR
jgi:catechol 2,3-dioxygenase-like lactoylglutathione lyase family enzyme